MKNKFAKSFYSILILCLYLIVLCGCKTKYFVEYINESEPGLQSSLQIPVYEDYKEFSDYIRDQLLKDYYKYKEYAIDEWNFYQSETLTYRTVFKDLSNSRYINVYMEKYIPAGPSLEDEYIITFCYDKKNKQVVDITQITGMNVEELSSYCKSYLKTNIQDVDDESRSYINNDIDSGMVEKKERYSCFTVDNKKIIIYFPPNEIVSRYYGVQTVEISLK